MNRKGMVFIAWMICFIAGWLFFFLSKKHEFTNKGKIFWMASVGFLGIAMFFSTIIWFIPL